MHTYELLNHEPDQYLWGQNADEDLEQSSRPVSLITSLLRSFQAARTYLMCSLQLGRMCLLQRRSPSLWLHTTAFWRRRNLGKLLFILLWSLFLPISYGYRITGLHRPPKQLWKAQELQILLLCKNY